MKHLPLILALSAAGYFAYRSFELAVENVELSKRVEELESSPPTADQITEERFTEEQAAARRAWIARERELFRAKMTN